MSTFPSIDRLLTIIKTNVQTATTQGRWFSKTVLDEGVSITLPQAKSIKNSLMKLGYSPVIIDRDANNDQFIEVFWRKDYEKTMRYI
jgi:hypothetical protein